MYPLSSLNSRYVDISRPNASEDERSSRRFVTKPVLARQSLRPRAKESRKRTLRATPKVHRPRHARHLEEDGNRTNEKSQTSPGPLDDSLLDESVEHAHAKCAVHVLDKGEIVPLDDVLLDHRSAVQSDLFGVLEETRVREAEFSFEASFFGGITTEGGSGNFDCGE